MPSRDHSWAPSLSVDVLPQPGGIGLAVLAIGLTAMAAGTGWGIRGQYGHETGAMIAGTMASLTLVMLFVPRASSLTALRAAAMMTAAIGIGGSMTYGQTVGLTHDHEIVGDVAAWRWGMLGLFVKGGVWIGFGGVLLGMGLSGKRYRPFEMLLLMAALIALMFVGIRYINGPYDPDHRILPQFYFSDSWDFEPDKADLTPRRETWGGYWLALVALLAYARIIKGDRLALRLGLIAIVAGGLGFAGGQCTQSLHAWHPEIFAEDGRLGFAHDYTKYFNWWNVMETTFGFIWGAILALGVYLNRHLIEVGRSDDELVSIPYPLEIILCAAHIGLVILGEFHLIPIEQNLDDGIPQVTASNIVPIAGYVYTEYGLILAAIPLICIVGGRLWPYLMLMTVVAVPICGKTLNALCTQEGSKYSMREGWIWFVGIPLAVCFAVGVGLILRSQARQSGGRAAAVALMFTTLLYFGLNTVFFDFAWPWLEWTSRTPNQTVFMISSACLVIAAVISYLVAPAVSRLSDLRR